VVPNNLEITTTPVPDHAVERPDADANRGDDSVVKTLPPPDASPIPAKAKVHNIRVSPAVLDAAEKEGDELLHSLSTAPQGLTQAEVEERMRTSGPNEVAQERRQGWPVRLLKIIRNPLVILLAVLSAVSFSTGDARAGTVMAAMVVLSGDNDLISRKVCRDVGLSADPMLQGADVEKMSDAELADASEKTTLFARLSPAHKQRVIRALRSKGHVVGFMGDGINDAPALRAADVGISVDTATDIAKESADLILLEKDLMVLEGGVIEGRKVFANILKYIRMGASSNFGNMFSVLGASAFLPFIPMAPIQVLTNNLLYDFSQLPIPVDSVDEEQVARPRPWNIDEIKRFILCIGPISSIFDYTTFFVMLWVFHCWDPSRAAVFQTGWFVESLMTQTLIIHVIRTNRIPFLQSRASLPLTITTFSIMAFGAWLPYSPLASSLGLAHLPGLYWPILMATLVCYVGLTQLTKIWLLRKKWI